MTDQALRELERGWRQSGSPEDEALLLRERLRVGELSARRAELASYLGYPAAREAAAVEAPEDFAAWLGGLEAWEGDPRTRAALAIARAVLPLFDAAGLTPEFALRPRRALEALERWIDCPCSACLQQLSEASGRARFTLAYHDSTDVSRAASQVAVYAGLCTGTARNTRLDTTAHYLPVVAKLALEVRPEGTLRSAVQADLAPWALGYRDPVRERLEARSG